MSPTKVAARLHTFGFLAFREVGKRRKPGRPSLRGCLRESLRLLLAAASLARPLGSGWVSNEQVYEVTNWPPCVWLCGVVSFGKETQPCWLLVSGMSALPLDRRGNVEQK